MYEKCSNLRLYFKKEGKNEKTSICYNHGINYEKNGVIYSLNVDVTIPDVGFYSSSVASQGTFIRDFTVTDTEKTFYLMADNGLTIEDVKLLYGAEDGYTGDEVCASCGVVVKKGEAIKAIGHKYVSGICINCQDKVVINKTVEEVDTSKTAEEVKESVSEGAIEEIQKEIESVPETGDDRCIILWGIYLMISFCVVLVVGKKRCSIK